MLLPFQLMVCVGAAITYTITGGMSLRRIWLLTCPGKQLKDVRLGYAWFAKRAK